MGEYMNVVKHNHTTNLTDVYRKSMDYLLNNPYNFARSQKYGDNYIGAVHSKIGKGHANGTSYYAMYGNSFSVAALNQYKKISGTDVSDSLNIRLSAIDRFLLHSDILTKDGAYWSMLDYQRGSGYVDQAYRKWIETHATGWITYYLLQAYQYTPNNEYLSAIKKTLTWLVKIQSLDGSFPKYFEKNMSSRDRLGDIAWVVLAFYKAAELEINIPEVDIRERANLATDWICKELVPKKEYFGSFEDVGGVNDSYCPTITARALMEAYKQSGKKNDEYLLAAEQALSVSLAWISTGYTVDSLLYLNEAWDKKYRFQPTYSQVESTTCYWPCSYTLPALFLASSEFATYINDVDKKTFWQHISQLFSHVSDFMLENPDTKTKYGMEWLLSPFLVFTEWGNAQLCWSIIETLRNRIQLFMPGFRLDSIMHGDYQGGKYTLFMPAWKENEDLISLDANIDPVYFKNDSGQICLFLLGEGQTGIQHITFKSLLKFMNGNRFELKDIRTGRILGNYSKRELEKGINIEFNQSLFFICQEYN